MSPQSYSCAEGGAEALKWFNRQRAGLLSPHDERLFDAWLSSDPENRQEYARVEQAWVAAGLAEDSPVIMEICERVDRRLAVVKRTRALGAVAAIAMTLSGGVWAATQTEILKDIGAQSSSEFRTRVGERTKVTLADGSVVTLDTNTVLRTKMSWWRRRVNLERGQASFEVAKDRSRPFIVAAAGMTVRATGTAFDVRAEPGRFEVTLIEGRVRVQELGREDEDAPMANMRPGWRLAVGEDARWRMEPVDIVKETSWHDGILTFYGESLEKAAAEMNRYSRRQIVFRGMPPAKTIIGHFRTGDVEGFASAAELNKVARVVLRTEDRIELVAQ